MAGIADQEQAVEVLLRFYVSPCHQDKSRPWPRMSNKLTLTQNSGRPNPIPTTEEIQTRHCRVERNPKIAEQHRLAHEKIAVLETGESLTLRAHYAHAQFSSVVD